MVISALSFLAGLLLAQQFPLLPGLQWLIVGAVAACIITWLRYWRCLFFVLGVLWAIVFALYRLSERLPEPLEGKEIQLAGTVSGLPVQDERRVRFDFMTMDGVQSGTGAALPAKLRLSWYYPDQAVKSGQQWLFTVKLKRVHGSFNPGGFDYERWAFAEGIGATGYVRSGALLGREAAWRSVSVWRQQIADELSERLSQRPGFALIKALTIGDGSHITQEQWDIFRRTGTTHLMVISGLHIGLVAGLVYFLALKIWARTGFVSQSPQKIAAIAAMLAALLYAALAGFSVPTQRSLVMLCVAMMAVILQRNSRPFNTLAVALFAVLIIDPLAVLAAGFWLSFLAVSVIVYALSGRLGAPHYVAGAIKVHWVTSVALSPLLLLFFQQVSLIAPFANLIAVPVISLLVVPLSLLAVVVMFISSRLADALFYVTDSVLQGLWWLLTQLADIPLASVHYAPPAYWVLLFAVPGIVLLLAPAGIPGGSRWLGLVILLPLAFTEPKRPDAGDINMTLLDVGQGLSAVVQTAEHLLVFDTGAKFSAQNDSGQRVLLPFLRSQGAAKIDRLIISHGDNDHIGGAASLMRGMATEQVLTSVPQQLSDYAPSTCVAGQAWQWDGVEFTVLSPGSQAFARDNDNSCVLKIESKHGTVLLTGDIEAAAESWLVKTYGEDLKAEVLIAPHHGSKTSSTVAFLQAVQPHYVLIPAGYRSQFGHPHRTVLARYRDINASWLSSANSGAISVNVENNAWIIKGIRESESRYWNIK